MRLDSQNKNKSKILHLLNKFEITGYLDGRIADIVNAENGDDTYYRNKKRV
jgi:hypothetical protein